LCKRQVSVWLMAQQLLVYLKGGGGDVCDFESCSKVNL